MAPCSFNFVHLNIVADHLFICLVAEDRVVVVLGLLEIVQHHCQLEVHVFFDAVVLGVDQDKVAVNVFVVQLVMHVGYQKDQFKPKYKQLDFIHESAFGFPYIID